MKTARGIFATLTIAVLGFATAFGGGLQILTQGEFFIASQAGVLDTLGRKMVIPDSMRIVVTDSNLTELHDQWYVPTDPECALDGDVIKFSDTWANLNGAATNPGNFNVSIVYASDGDNNIDVFSHDNFTVKAVAQGLISVPSDTAVGGGSIIAELAPFDNIITEQQIANASGRTTTGFASAGLTQATDDWFVGSQVLFIGGAIDGQVARITSFTASTDAIVYTPATTAAIGSADSFYIVGLFVEAPGAGSGDWTAGEKDDIRDALGVVGTKGSATGGDLQANPGLTWDELKSAHTTANTFGDFLDIEITSRLAPTVAARTLDIASTGEAGVDLNNVLGTLSGAEIALTQSEFTPNYAVVGDAMTLNAAGVDLIWDELKSGHSTANSFGDFLDDEITSRLAPTVAARTLDVATTGEAGVDFGNILGVLSGGEIALTQAEFTPDYAVIGDAMTLNAAGVDLIWDELKSGHSTANSFGDFLDDEITSRLAPTVAARTLDVAVTGEAGVDLNNVLGTLSGGEIALTQSEFTPDYAVIGDAMTLNAAGVDLIWDETQAGHTTASTFGKFLDTEVSGVGGGTPSLSTRLIGLRGTVTANAGDRLTGFSSAGLNAATNDLLVGNQVFMIDGSGVHQIARITDFQQATDSITFTPAFVVTPGGGDSFYVARILAEAPAAGSGDWSAAEKDDFRDALGIIGTKGSATGGDLQANPGLTWDELKSAHTTANTFGDFLDDEITSRLSATVEGRTLDVAATGEAGADFNNILGVLSGAEIALTQSEFTPDYAEQAEVVNLNGWNPNTDPHIQIGGTISGSEIALTQSEFTPNYAVIGDAMTLNPAGVDLIWDEEQSGHNTVTTFGKFLDDEITSRLAPTVAARTLDIATTGEAGVDLNNVLGTLSGSEIALTQAEFTPSYVQISDNIGINADDVTGSFNTADFENAYFTNALFNNDAIDAAVIHADVGTEYRTTFDATHGSGSWETGGGGSALSNRFIGVRGQVTANAGDRLTGFASPSLNAATTNQLVGNTVFMIDGSAFQQVARITAFTPGTDSITFTPAFVVTPGSGDSFYTAMILVEEPGAGATDWTSAEKDDFRDALGIVGTKGSATGGDVQANPGLTWDELQSAHTTVATFGKFLDTEVSGVGGGSSDWTSDEKDDFRDALGIVGVKGTASGGDLQANPGLTWDELKSAHTTANTFGDFLDDEITSRLAPTVAARTLDIATTGEAGVDFSNVRGILSGGEIALTQAEFTPDYSVLLVTDNIGVNFSDINGVLSGGEIALTQSNFTPDYSVLTEGSHIGLDADDVIGTFDQDDYDISFSQEIYGEFTNGSNADAFKAYTNGWVPINSGDTLIVNVRRWLGTIPLALSNQRVRTSVESMLDNVIGAAQLDDDASTEIYDKFILGNNEDQFKAALTGHSLSAAGIDAILDNTFVNNTVANSMGTVLSDSLNNILADSRLSVMRFGAVPSGYDSTTTIYYPATGTANKDSAYVFGWSGGSSTVLYREMYHHANVVTVADSLRGKPATGPALKP